MSRSIRISDELWAALKTRSVALRTTLQAVAEEAASEYLGRRSSESVAVQVAGVRRGSDVTVMTDAPVATVTLSDPPVVRRTGLDAAAQRSYSGAGRCACDHLETMHPDGKRCQAIGCGCRKFASREDLP